MTIRTPTPLKSRPSLRDLAKRLGVSHTTVNMALQGDKRVSESLKDMIRTFAEQEGYFPNDLAAGLRTGRTGLLGIVTPMINSAFISCLLDGAIKALWQAGYFPITLCSQLDLEAEAEMLQSLARRRVEGVLLMPSREDSGTRHFAQLLKEHIPIIAINNPIPKLDLPLVASDDVFGGELATKYLISAGHTHILHIGSPLDSRYADRRREMGYRQAMTEAGLKPRVVHYDDRLGPVEDLTKFREKLARSITNGKSTAVFCFNDSIALEVYAFCEAEGIRVPDEVSVIGYSNEGWKGKLHSLDFVSPPLTTIDQHSGKIGESAAATLVKLIETKEVNSESLLLKPSLVERSSVKKR